MQPGYAVVNVKTTGFGAQHRIVELAIVQCDHNGEQQRRWESLVQPGRDIPDGKVHGLRAADLTEAPPFAKLVSEILGLLSGRIVVAHNAPFDVGFLERECTRAGASLPDLEGHVLSTRSLMHQLRPNASAQLSQCAQELGIELEELHCARRDAVATAELLARLIAAGTLGEGEATGLLIDVPGLPPTTSVAVPRPQHSEPTATWLKRLADHLPPASEEAVENYRHALHAMLSDHELTRGESAELLDLAHRLGISRSDVTEIHEDYVCLLAIAAWSDGVVQEQEARTIRRLAAQLGVPERRVQEQLDAPIALNDASTEQGITLLPGQRIAFTGSTVVPREEWEHSARSVGLVPSGFNSEVVLLVAADINTHSAKARAARERNIPIVTESTFASLLRDLSVQQSFDAHQATVQIIQEDEHSMGVFQDVFPWIMSLESRAWGVEEIVSEWTERYPHRRLSRLSPQLTSAMVSESIDPTSTTARQWFKRFSDPLDASVRDLADLRGVGPLKLRSILSALVLQALDGGDATELRTPSSPESSDLEEWEKYRRVVADVRILQQWAQLSGQSMLGPLLKSAPTSVIAAADEVRSLASPFNSHENIEDTMKEELAGVWANDQRNELIFQRRVIGGETLEAIGQELGVTRERVRQLETAMRKRWNDAPTLTMVCAALATRMLPLSRRTEAESVFPFLANPVRGTSIDWAELLTLLFRRWELDGEWIVSPDFSEAAADALKELRDGYGLVSLERIAEHLVVSTNDLRGWLQDKGWVIREDTVFSSVRSLNDKAAATLAFMNEPMTSAQIGQEWDVKNIRSMANQLAVDPRMHRVGQDLWALVEWGGEEYTTIATWIGRRIDNAGGKVALKDLLDKADSIRVAENSIRFYSNNGEFLTHPDPDTGQLMVTHGTGEVTIDAVPEETAGLYWRQGLWSYLVTANHDHMRGSGTPVPRVLAKMMEIPFLGSVPLATGRGDVPISFGRAGCTIGSIRQLLVDHGITEGDRFWLRIDPQQRTLEIVHATSPRPGLTGLAAVLNAIGADDRVISDDDAARKAIVCEALGLPANATLSAIVHRLDQRREQDLVQALSEQ